MSEEKKDRADWVASPTPGRRVFISFPLISQLFRCSWGLDFLLIRKNDQNEFGRSISILRATIEEFSASGNSLRREEEKPSIESRDFRLLSKSIIGDALRSSELFKVTSVSHVWRGSSIDKTSFSRSRRLRLHVLYVRSECDD